MKIIKLTAENIKRIKAIEVVPHGNTIVISGRNGQGKTSVLDSIWLALSGSSAAKTNSMPVTKGEKSARIEIELDDFIVTRTWLSNDRSRLEVRSKEGASFPSPQKMLDGLIGKLSFDPFEFSRMSSKDQKELLLNVVDIDVDLDALTEEYKEKFTERTIIGREAKTAEGHFKSLEKPQSNPKGDDSIQSIRQEWQESIQHDKAIEMAENKYDNTWNSVVQLREQLKMAEVALESAEKNKKELIKNRPDRQKIEARLHDAEEREKNLAKAKEWEIAKEEYTRLSTNYTELSTLLEGILKTKEDAMKRAKMPLPGLVIGEDGILFNDIPFSQLSASEQLKVSMSIAMSINPKLRIIRIMDGSLLDKDNMKVIDEMAKAEDFQVWIEYVDDSGNMGIYIEDGRVIKVNN